MAEPASGAVEEPQPGWTSPIHRTGYDESGRAALRLLAAAVENERLRAMLHQVAWHAADAADMPDWTEVELRAALRRLAATATRVAEGSTPAHDEG